MSLVGALLHVLAVLAPLHGAPSPVATATATATADGGALAIRFSGLRSGDGKVLVAIFRGEDGFPMASEKAWKRMVVPIRGTTASVDLEGLPAGEYAISAVHDENGNNELDTNFIGIPKEGLGASNNAKGRMGPPKYRDARFSVGAEPVTQSIRIVYL